jgi:hypothetical protein
MKTMMRNATRMLTVVAALALANLSTEAATVSEDFESLTLGGTTPPIGWSFVDITGNADNAYIVTTGASGGLGGQITGDNETGAYTPPGAYIVHSGGLAFSASNSISGTFDFNIVNIGNYDSCNFFIGDIKTGYTAASAGEFWEMSLAQNSFGTRARLYDGVATILDGPQDLSAGTWYSASFSWTPTNNLQGDISFSTTSGPHIWTQTYNGFTYDSDVVFVGFGATGPHVGDRSGVFDNISITGTLILESPAVSPTLAASDIVDADPDDTIEEFVSVTYTVSFSEFMDASTVTTNAFSNAAVSPAPISVDSVTRTDTNVFEVTVTATGGTGDLVLSVSSNVTDLSGNLMMADVDDNTTITVTGDSTPPSLLLLDPAQGDEIVIPGANLVATFDEDISLLGGGVITITNLTDGAATAITLPDGQVTAADATVTINPSTDLDLGDAYAVLFDANAVEDASGNNFAGIADTNTWRFETAGPPTVTLNGGADSIGNGTARLRGALNDGDSANTYFVWGTSDPGTGSTNDWENIVSMGVFAEAVQFTTTLNGLLYGQTYYYRTFASNIYGDDWSASADSFLTLLPSSGGGGGTLTAGVTLNWDTDDAGSAVDAANWNSLTANSTYDWDFLGGVTLEAVTSSGTIIDDAYRFTGGTADNSNLDWTLLSDTSDASWEFWLKPDDTGTLDADQVIFESGGAGDGMNIWYQPGAVGDNSGTVNFTIDNGAVQGTVSAVIDTTDFRHIACVFDLDNSGSTDRMEIYVDGVSVDTYDVDGIADWTGTDDGGLGNFFGAVAETSSTGQFDGDISVFRFWENKALSPAEVEENFKVLQTTGNDPTPGADIYLNAGDDDGANSTWEDAKGIWDLTLSTSPAVMYVADAGSAHPGITAAYDFPGGSGSKAEGASFETLGWEQQPVSVEIWFKPDSTADDGANGGQVLWETGGGSGLGIFYNDGEIECAGDTTETISSYDVSSLASEFIQVVLTYNTAGGNNFVLYVNGSQVATGDRADTDYSGSDPAALGGRGATNVGGRGNGDGDAGKETESFEGQIAIFRAYRNQILTAGQVSDNYDAVATSPASGLGMINNTAENIGDTSADLLGTLNGADSVFDVTVYWSTVNNANSAAWIGDATASNQLVGTFSDANGLSVTGAVSSLTGGTTYYYTMLATNAATNIWATPNATFATPLGDAIPPVIASLSPSNTQIDVVTTTDLIVTFDEGVLLLGGGVITITNLSDGTASGITLPDAQITSSTSNMTINPSTDLNENDTYAVLIDNVSVKDLFNNNFAGILDTNTWAFTVLGTPPTLAPTAFVDDIGGGPINMNRLITYTVTFSEDIDASSVTSGDFENALDAPITIGSVSEASPGVFTVEVTATNSGDLQLSVPIGAVITDVAGNALDTASAIADNTTITILFARTIIFEPFELPTGPTAYSQGTLPTSNNWVGTTAGFAGNRHGITDKAGGDFSAPDPNHQAYAFRYTGNQGITTAENELGLLVAGVTYTVTFDVVEDAGGGTDTEYHCALMVFDPGAARNDVTSGIGTDGSLVKYVTGDGPSDGSFETISFSYTVDAVTNAAQIGKDIGVRFRGLSDASLIDNVLIEDNSSGDIVPPGILTLLPADNGSSVAVDANLVAQFTENVTNGTGNIVIRLASDNSIVHTLDVNGANVSISGDSVTIDPPSDFLEGTDYYVQIGTNAVHDGFANPYAGITDTTTWNFTTLLEEGRNLLLQGSFESPVVSGQNLTTDPDGWDRSIDGAFNSSRSGLFNEDTGTFSTPDGAQAGTVSYNTAALTSLESATSQTLQPFGEYTVRFRAAKGSTLNGDFKVELLAFNVGEDREGDDVGAVLNSVAGVATTSDMSEQYAFTFIPNPGNAHLGKLVAVQIEGNGALVDEVRLTYTPPPTTIFLFK